MSSENRRRKRRNGEQGRGMGGWNGGRGMGRGGPKKVEQRSRTLKFTNFPQDTAEKVIIDTMKEKFTEVDAEIEEYFAYGKYADADGARFMKEEDMWPFLQKNAKILISSVMDKRSTWEQTMLEKAFQQRRLSASSSVPSSRPIEGMAIA